MSELSGGQLEVIPPPDAPNPGKEGVPVVPGSAEKQVDLSGKPADAMVATPAPEAGTIHGEFVEKTKAVDEPTAKADIGVLTGKSPEAYTIEDIRYNQRLLKKKEDDKTPEDSVKNLKEETARRMKAYSTDAGNGWFQLDYEKLGSDKNGLTHELYVGLGDILLDLDIQKIAVEKKGQVIQAHRGVASSGKNAGRVCFLDDSNEYVATNTGDKFRILSSEKMDVPAYTGKLAEETTKRESSRASFKTGTVDLYTAEKDVSMKEGIDLKETYKDRNGKDVTVGVTNDIIEKATAECGASAGIEKAVDQRKNLMEVLKYIGYKVGVPPYAILAVTFHECGVKFPVTGGNQDGGLAKGMGQIHPEGWATVKGDPKFSEIVGQVMKETPGEAGRNKNLFVDLVGVAIFLKRGLGVFGFQVDHNTSAEELTQQTVESPDGIKMTRLAWLRMYYHVPSYATDYAKAIKAGNIDALGSYKERFLTKSKPWLEKNMHRYIKLSENAALAHRSMVTKGVLSA